jgi:hypothetical protein
MNEDEAASPITTPFDTKSQAGGKRFPDAPPECLYKEHPTRLAARFCRGPSQCPYSRLTGEVAETLKGARGVQPQVTRRKS